VLGQDLQSGRHRRRHRCLDRGRQSDLHRAHVLDLDADAVGLGTAAHEHRRLEDVHETHIVHRVLDLVGSEVLG